MDRHDDDWPIHRKVHGAASVGDGVRPHPVRISDGSEVEVERGPARRRDEGRVLEISCDSQAQLAIRRRRLRLDKQHDELPARSARAVEARHRPRQLPRCCFPNDRGGPVVSPGARESRTPSVDPVCVPVIAAFRVGGPGCPLGIRMALSLSFASRRTASVAWPAAIVTSRVVEACSLPVVGVAKGGFTVSQIRPTKKRIARIADEHAGALQEHDHGSPRVMEHGRPRP